MRILPLFILLITLATARAQGTNSPPPNSTPTNSTPTVRSSPQLLAPGRAPELILREPKANEIVKGRVTYSGVAVEIFKTRKPWQLINPAAPAAYGSPEDNVVREAPKGRILGLKLFAISF